jgi:protein TonB
LFAHIEYPNQAKAKGVEGIVKVEFTVTELGMVEDIEIIEGIGSGCDEEVIKALERTRFSPAVQNGRFVKVKLSQSILFELKSLRR